jgi:hypothetical protein
MVAIDLGELCTEGIIKAPGSFTSAEETAMWPRR